MTSARTLTCRRLSRLSERSGQDVELVHKKERRLKPPFCALELCYSPTTVRPSVDATASNLVCVVDPEGTYMVLVVPDFLVTKEEQADTTSEPI